MRNSCQRHTVRSILYVCVLLLTSAGCLSLTSSLSTFAQTGDRYDGHAWSPDGRWLAAESSDTTKLSLFSATGQLVNELRLGCLLGNGQGDFSWLPDGRLSCLLAEDRPLLDLITLDQRGQVRTSTTISVPIPARSLVYGLQWNPQHFWLATIAAAASPPSADGASILYLSDLAGHRLMLPMPIQAGGLAWSRDGTRLALVQQDGTVVLWQVQQRSTGQLTLSKLRQLTAATTDEYVEWSPSGRWLVCRHGSYQSEDYLFLLATDGSGTQVKLTSSTTEGQLDLPAWSPDEKRLIVGRVADGALMSLDIATLLKQKGVTP